MKTSIKEELTEHINDNTGNHVFTDKSDLHHHLFNSNYYIIGYWNAQQWLDKHGISVFEALETIRKYEEFNYYLIASNIHVGLFYLVCAKTCSGYCIRI